ncbi:MAG TPA: hypothetical protein PK440_13345 [Candidatus Accumulibacter phosphatis]|nr:MAG: hypothetical protein AW07_00696 [Candidatus Accumulibacter sp. SK-11]HAY26830.1 hypothetical protein [Accumulibacter sp.]HCV12406.1 hypothetical protein [Accumulibacter sp.]HRL74395.1 hypothetical protein [Candidatus Accumulibacter phosphatis]HRQ95965.1 hypothetical protein [Candidatus Accumulibacter phosphatis]
MSSGRLLLSLLPLLVACSDQRAAFEIDGSRQHALTLIRVQTLPWDRTARYSIVAARMPDCQRRHEIGAGGADSRVEVFAPGNDAWILRQGKRMYVVETRTCEGFARLEGEPEDGLGALQGSFQLRNGTLAWVGEPAGAPPATAGATVGQ